MGMSMELGQLEDEHGQSTVFSTIVMSHTRTTSRLPISQLAHAHETIVQSAKVLTGSSSSYNVTLPVTTTMGVGLGGSGVGSARRRPPGTSVKSA